MRPACLPEARSIISRFVALIPGLLGVWKVFDKRYWWGDGIADHFSFVLRNEPWDLLVMKRVLAAMAPEVIIDLVKSEPTGSVARRAWFFYEHLTGSALDLDDAPQLTAVNALDPKAYFTGRPRLSRRHRVRDNLLGTAGFSPVIRRTASLEAYVGMALEQRVGDALRRAGNRLMSRAASFLLLADSRASFYEWRSRSGLAAE